MTIPSAARVRIGLVLLGAAVLVAVAGGFLFGIDDEVVWALEVRGDVGESPRTLLTDGNRTVFDGAVMFTGDANGDRARDVTLRFLDSSGTVLETLSVGTMRNEPPDDYENVTARVPTDVDRVSIAVTSLETSTDEYSVWGWRRADGDGWTTYAEDRSEYHRPAAD